MIELTRKLHIKNEVQLLENSYGELKIRVGNKVTFTIYKNKSLFKKIYKALEKGTSYKRLIDKCDSTSIEIITHFLKFFEQNSFLTDCDYYGIHDRQIRYFSLVNNNKNIDEFIIQKSIGQSKILIVGLGGIGTHIAYCLTTCGIATIGLCDFDIIEESNISRCIGFTKDDIGSQKTIVLDKFLSSIHQGISIKTHSNKIQKIPVKTLALYDFIIITIDKSIEIEIKLITLLRSLKIPYIFANYGDQYGMISKIYQSAYIINENLKDRFKIINNTYHAPSVFWNTMIIAGITCKEVLAYISNGMTSFSKDYKINMNLDTLSINFE